MKDSQLGKLNELETFKKSPDVKKGSKRGIKYGWLLLEPKEGYTRTTTTISCTSEGIHLYAFESIDDLEELSLGATFILVSVAFKVVNITKP